MSVVDRSFDHPLAVEEKAVEPLMGGLMNYGYQCGMVWGVALAAGAQAYRLRGPGSQAEAEAIVAAQRLVSLFRVSNKNEFNCMEISELNLRGEIQALPILKFFLKGGPIGCLRMAARYAPKAFDEINATFSEQSVQAPTPPVSCTALLAKQMGLSDMHTTMMAGLAGGIGLCGGGCGALGAAIWILGMNLLNDGLEVSLWESKEFQTKVAALIDTFVQTAGGLECSEITGREFEDIEDHASFLHAGGCSEVIKIIAELI